MTNIYICNVYCVYSVDNEVVFNESPPKRALYQNKNTDLQFGVGFRLI